MSNITLTEGDVAPDFSLENQDGTFVDLKSLVASGPVVIYFYPKDFTPGCTTEACDFRDLYDKFVESGVKVVGISPDTAEKHKKFIAEYELNFDLLSDPTKATMAAYGAFGEKMNYGKVVSGVIRSTFLIGKDQLVKKAMYGVKAKGHASRVVNLLPIS